MPVNPQADIDAVRAYSGGRATTNLPDSDIDDILTQTADEVIERVGPDATPSYLPNLRRKLHLLIATAEVLIRYIDTEGKRANILSEIETLAAKLTNPEPQDDDAHTIVDSVDYQSYPLNVNGSYYSGIRRRFIPRGLEGLGTSTFIGI